MPTIFRDQFTPIPETGMSPYAKMFLVAAIAISSFTLGWFTSTKGYHVAGADGHPLTRSNAAQTVKSENARLGQEVVGLLEQQAADLLAANDRTMFVGVRDGEMRENKEKKTFTNLTVEVKGGRVTKVLGWY